ncbi:MAG: EF-hand domain-containing protein [Sulfuricella sp.]|nr:EF-hand domain-containing protein [Sulfuricella sp.]
MSMAISGMGSAAAPQAMSGASGRMPPAQKIANLFDKIDSSGSGTITKAQFEQAFQNQKMPQAFKAMGADAIFSKLDSSGSGSISKQDFVNGMKSLMSQVRQHRHGEGGNAAQSASSSATAPAQTLSYSLESLNSLGTQASPASGSLLKTTA